MITTSGTATPNFYTISSVEEYARIHPMPLIAATRNGRCGILAELLFSGSSIPLTDIGVCLETLIQRDDQQVDDDNSNLSVDSDPAFSLLLCYLRKLLTEKRLLVQGRTIVTPDGAQQLDMQALCDQIRTQFVFFHNHWLEEIQQTLSIPERFSLQLALTSHIDHSNADIASYLICYHLSADSTLQHLQEDEHEQLFYFNTKRSLEEIKNHVGSTIYSQSFLDDSSSTVLRLCRAYTKSCIDAKDLDTLAYYTNKLSCLMQENALLFPYTAYQQIINS